MATRRKSSSSGKGSCGGITAWSFSRFIDYSKCPRLAKYKHVDKIREPSNKAMARGTAIHKLAETYVGGPLTKLPDELAKFSAEFKALRRIRKRVRLEAEIAVTKTWEPTGWFDDDAWLRVKYDAGYLSPDGKRFTVIDHKTGKVDEARGSSQLSLYAPALFVHLPASVEVLVAELWYLDAGEIIEEEYTRSAAEDLRTKWEKEVAKMLSDTVFSPTPGTHCTWCFFSRSKQGSCEF